MAKRKITSDAVGILHDRYIKGKPHRVKSLQRERQKAGIAAQIYKLRTKAGLSQKALADLVGTTQSVISRLEDADYNGHSIQMLNRIEDRRGSPPQSARGQFTCALFRVKSAVTSITTMLSIRQTLKNL